MVESSLSFAKGGEFGFLDGAVGKEIDATEEAEALPDLRLAPSSLRIRQMQGSRPYHLSIH